MDGHGIECYSSLEEKSNSDNILMGDYEPSHECYFLLLFLRKKNKTFQRVLEIIDFSTSIIMSDNIV